MTVKVQRGKCDQADSVVSRRDLWGHTVGCLGMSYYFPTLVHFYFLGVKQFQQVPQFYENRFLCEGFFFLQVLRTIVNFSREQFV